VPLIVEMKTDDPELGRRVAAEVQAAGAADRVCAAGEWRHSLQAARAALPRMASSACRSEVRTALYRSRVFWPVRQPPYTRYQVPETAGPTRVVSPRFIRHAHGAGLTVEVWTVDDPGDMARLLGWGVDALITNRPDVAVAVRDEHCRRP
jgi:glycerophosphoryl diester phosphodiesterase